jgi:anti-sigma regulatory factor (Ser/Thr protein kinase)
VEFSESVTQGVALAEGEPRAEIVLAAEPSSLSTARCFVTSMLELWDREDPEQIAPLLTSEIVANALRHATGRIGLELSLRNSEELRVRVRDETPDAPVIPRSSPDGIGGHGLTIIEALARSWGVERYEDCKVVWFETPVSPRAPRAVAAAHR